MPTVKPGKSAGFLGQPRAIAAAAFQPAAEVRRPQLDFALQRQQQTQWCWAAVTSSVAAFYGTTVSQQDLAKKHLQLTTIPDPLPGPTESWAGNRPFRLTTALRGVGHLNPDAFDLSLDGAVDGALGFDAIKTQIGLQRPICCILSIEHCVVVNGFDESTKEVFVSDPAGGLQGYHKLDMFTGAAGTRWKQTCLTK